MSRKRTAIRFHREAFRLAQEYLHEYGNGFVEGRIINVDVPVWYDCPPKDYSKPQLAEPHAKIEVWQFKAMQSEKRVRLVQVGDLKVDDLLLDDMPEWIKENLPD